MSAYNLRPRRPKRTDPLLTACHDYLPPDILEYILLLRLSDTSNGDGKVYAALRAAAYVDCVY